MKVIDIEAKAKAQEYLGNEVYLSSESLNDGFEISWLPVQVKQQLWQTKDDKSFIRLVNYFGWKTYDEAYRLFGNKFHNLSSTQSIIAQLLFNAGFQKGKTVYQFNQRKFYAQLLPLSLPCHSDVYFCICPSFCDLYFHFIYGAYQITCAQVLLLENWRSHNLFKDFDYSNYRRNGELKIYTSDVYEYLEEKIPLPKYRIDLKKEESSWAYFLLKDKVYHGVWDF